MSDPQNRARWPDEGSGNPHADDTPYRGDDAPSSEQGSAYRGAGVSGPASAEILGAGIAGAGVVGSGLTAEGLDPTLMRNQPALRTSTGALWLIVGAFFVIASLIPLVFIVAAGGPAFGVAVTTIVLVVLLYLAMVVVRFAVPSRVGRLRAMAASCLALAAIALLGVVLCVMLDR